MACGSTGERTKVLSPGYLRDAAVPTDYHTDCYFVRATPTER
jgi:hypothetical protein